MVTINGESSVVTIQLLFGVGKWWWLAKEGGLWFFFFFFAFIGMNIGSLEEQTEL